MNLPRSLSLCLRMLFVIVVVITARPKRVDAHGLSIELSETFAAPEESAFRVVSQRSAGFFSVGPSVHVSVIDVGPFRIDGTAGWTTTRTEGRVFEFAETDFLEHTFSVGARLRWTHFWFLQPYAAVRGGAALGWLDLRGDQKLEAFDAALRVEPSIGVDAFVPFSAIGGDVPDWTAELENSRGFSKAGIGLGLAFGARFQRAYSFDGSPSEPDDDDLRADQIDVSGTHLGRLSVSGLRFEFHVLTRF